MCVGVDFDAGAVGRATCFTAATEFQELLSACRIDLGDITPLATRALRQRCRFVPPANCRTGGFVGGRIEWVDAGDVAASDGASDATDAASDAATDAATDGGAEASDAGDGAGGGDAADAMGG